MELTYMYGEGGGGGQSIRIIVSSTTLFIRLSYIVLLLYKCLVGFGIATGLFTWMEKILYAADGLQIHERERERERERELY